MNMKKINVMVCILTVIFLLVLGGCGQKTTETGQDAGDVVQEETTEEALVTAEQAVLGEEGAGVEEMVVTESTEQTPTEDSEEAEATAEEMEAANPQSVDVAIRNYAFDEKTITVKAGDTVVWTNYDSAPHTVTATSGGDFDSGKMSKESTWSMTFDTPGTYEYYCAYHPSMTGKVVVE